MAWPLRLTGSAPTPAPRVHECRAPHRHTAARAARMLRRCAYTRGLVPAAVFFATLLHCPGPQRGPQRRFTCGRRMLDTSALRSSVCGASAASSEHCLSPPY